MKYSLVRELAVDGIPVTVRCGVLKFSVPGLKAVRYGLQSPCFTHWTLCGVSLDPEEIGLVSLGWNLGSRAWSESAVSS